MVMQKDKFLEFFYHDTIIHDISISQNDITFEQEVNFTLENEEYGKVNCFIPEVIFLDVNYCLNHIGCHQILRVEEDIEPNADMVNYIIWTKEVLGVASVKSFRVFSNMCQIDLFLQSDDILIEKL